MHIVHIYISVCGVGTKMRLIHFSLNSFTYFPTCIKSKKFLPRLLVTTPTQKKNKKKTSAKFLSYITYHIHAGIYMYIFFAENIKQKKK